MVNSESGYPSHETLRKVGVRREGLAKATGWLAGLLVVFALAFSNSPGPTVASAVSLMVIVSLLWREDFPPILLLPVLFQWSEVAILPISTIWNGQDLDSMSRFDANLAPAAYLGLAGVTSLGIGMYVGCGLRYRRRFGDLIRENTLSWPPNRVLNLSLAVIAGGYLLATAVSAAPGPLIQPILAASNMKYVGIFILIYSSLLTRRNYVLAASIVVGDMIFGMTGFFAEFKFTILTVLIAAITARPRLKVSDGVVVGIAVATILFVSVFWSAMKSDYRNFVNLGSGYQVVSVSMGQRLSYIGEFATSMDSSTVADGVDRLIRRHGYLDFLALTMQNVPDQRPHEYGAMTWAAITHILMPRILFPGKPPLPSDTAVMVTYTGLPPMWDLSRVSISLGNLTEMYIDFGVFGALILEFLLGCIVGAIALSLSKSPRCPPLISAGFCVMLVLPICYFGTALPKLVGSFGFSVIMIFLGRKYLVPTVLRQNGLMPS